MSGPMPPVLRWTGSRAGVDAGRTPAARRLEFIAGSAGPSSIVSMAPVIAGGLALTLLRHGRSTANETGVFTGWDDVALCETGRIQAHGGPDSRP